MQKINLLIILLLLNQLNSKASHIVGGEFQLKLKKGFNYELALRMYFDDISAAPGLLTYDLNINVGIYEKNTNKLVQITNLPRVSDDFIDYKYNECSDFNSSKVRTRLLFYTTDIYLDPTIFNSANGYYVTWERCCRNSSVSNIKNSRNMGQTFYLEFPAVMINGQRFINTSPIFNNLTGDFPCMQQTFNFPFGATDPDGDSLTYQMVTPWDGNDTDPPGPAPFTPVQWEVGYGVNNQIPGSPALKVDQNGNLTVKANKNGLFVFTVQCDEYRKGVKIGMIRREFQFSVINCPVSYEPQIEMKMPGCTGYYNQKDTLTLTIGESVCYNLFITDSTYNVFRKNKSLFLNIAETDLPSGTASLSFTSGTLKPGTDTLKPTLCINTCKKFPNNEDKTYHITVIVRDQSCPMPKTDTLFITLLIKPFPNHLPVVQVSPCMCITDTSIMVGKSLQFDVIGTDLDSADRMNLIAYGDGFNLSDAGMSFTNTSGYDSISSVFTWNVNCSAYKLGPVFKVIFQVQDDNCSSDDKQFKSVTLKLVDSPTTLNELSPANLLTPNDDGLNDFFEIKNLPPDNCEYYFKTIEVFNSWGSRIFADKTRDFKWNPSDNSDGVYYYNIDLNKKQIKGWLQVMR